MKFAKKFEENQKQNRMSTLDNNKFFLQLLEPSKIF